MLLFSCYYFAPVSYYSLLIRGQGVLIEQHDSYIKQTYRNRCRILGANGVLNLVIPVVKNHGGKTKMKDVRIDYDTDWRRIHLKGIEASYKSAPYYEFYMDAFEPFYSLRYEYLLDLNLDILKRTLELLEVDIAIELTTDYSKESSVNDLREAIHPKYHFSHKGFSYNPLPYYQVFSDRYGFCPDLSILDLLLNEGPRSISILRNSIEDIN